MIVREMLQLFSAANRLGYKEPETGEKHG